MTPERLRAFCLEFGASAEEFPFGPETSVFKVLGRMFALTALDGRPLSVTLKCDPDEAIRLRETYSAIVPGHHMSKRHWNTVTVSGVPDRLLREMVEDSYDLVVAQLPKAQRLRLDRP
ncbi:MmcQ/YjbR family DNA-binding protein [Streptomyces pratensis]|uniref:MmcQ/YjbR family DNA-binding protein n=1 Tax=Streptomyces pratensis TaxID=1169025 RepID=UPI003016AFDB